MKKIKVKQFPIWIIKRKDSNELYALEFFWIEHDAKKKLEAGNSIYTPIENFETIKLKLVQ